MTISTSVLDLVLSLVALLLTRFLVPALVSYLRSHVGSSNTQLLLDLARTAVASVEQQASSIPGDVKKGMAVDFLIKAAALGKINLSPELASHFIESAVKYMNDFKTLEPGTLLSAADYAAPLRTPDGQVADLPVVAVTSPSN